MSGQVRGVWQPMFERWRHGGWYVTNVRYPSGAVGCVSNNYPDKMWRIACDDRSPAPTFPSRLHAARAERERAREAFETVRGGVNYDLYREVVSALPPELLDRVSSWAHTDVVLRVAAADVRRERRQAVES